MRNGLKYIFSGTSTPKIITENENQCIQHEDFSDSEDVIDLSDEEIPTENEQEYIKVSDTRTIPKNNLKCLEPGEHLNGTIINGFIHILWRQKPNFFYFETDFYPYLHKKEENKIYSWKSSSKIKKIITKAIKNIDINMQQHIIIPINTENIHWKFSNINLKEKKIQIFNSFRTQREEIEDKEILENLKEFANCHILKENWATILEKSPQQNNDFDCGVFLLWMIAKVINGEDLIQPKISRSDIINLITSYDKFLKCFAKL